eukprot:m.304754 g.304754  ORF g.304754 m.304754 type:complete len:826 (-) comp17278_c0_seq1:63-2540(-)
MRARWTSSRVVAVVLVGLFFAFPSHTAKGASADAVEGKSSRDVSASKDLVCGGGARLRGKACACPADAPYCVGDRCLEGKSKKTGDMVHGFPPACKTCRCSDNIFESRRDPRLLILTVATHREPFIDLLEESVERLGLKLHIAGMGGFFKGYGWKLKTVHKFLVENSADFDIVLFADSFDTFIFCSAEEILDKFEQFNSRMVVSGEVNLWPNPNLAPYLPPAHRFGRYPFPNSGGYIAQIPYLIRLLEREIKIPWKSNCADDQGELIKALARKNHVFEVDINSKIFQTLYGYAKDDVTAGEGRVSNIITHSQPCMIHANGWDKGPLLRLLEQAKYLSGERVAALNERKATLEKAETLREREDEVNARCKNYNPNPSVEPERNLIAEYNLLNKQKILHEQLEQQNVPWYIMEQQLYEVQEYRAFCPRQANPILKETAQRQCEDFKVFIYPAEQSEEKFPMTLFYETILAVIRESPYYTENKQDACVFVPDFDISCNCESCLYSARDAVIETMTSEAYDTQLALEELPDWNDGQGFVMFDISDAPCSAVPVGKAIIAKVGLSSFHHRREHDISMPLFSMVEFSGSERRKPVEDRPYLLSFRGTRSARSDAMRNQLPKMHDGKDILLLLACRWYGDEHHIDGDGYDNDCAEQEEIFKTHTYKELAINSKFSLIVEGFGYHSFRLNEVMGAGSIPVIVIDHYRLPFAEFLDWSEFSVRVPEYRFHEIPKILRNLPPARVEQMQRRVVWVYEQFFKSLPLQIHTGLEIMRLNHLVDEERGPAARKLAEHGLPYADRLPSWHHGTPADVVADSKSCNMPRFRMNAQDGSRM